MRSEQKGLAIRALSLTKILIFMPEHQDQPISETGRRILQLIREGYGTRSSEIDGNHLRVTLDDVQCYIGLIKEADSHIFVLTASHTNGDYVSRNCKEDIALYLARLRPLEEMLPQSPISTFSVFTGVVSNQSEALTLLREYSAHFNRREAGVGVARGCLLAILESDSKERNVQVLKRDLLVAPFSLPPAEAVLVLSRFIEELTHLAIYAGKLYQLNQERRVFFPQLDPAEKEAQEKIEVILTRMKQFEQVTLEDLQTWLEEVTERFSGLSIMAGAMRRDYATAESYIGEMERCLTQWNEKSVEGYRSTSSVQLTEYRALAKPFKDFIDRTNALRTQLETVLDTVRTYLGIRQQRQSTETLERIEKLGELQAKMLNVIGKHEELLKRLTWWLLAFTIGLLILEIATAMHLLP